MNDSQAVCVGERVQHLLEDPGRVHRRQFPRTCQTRSKSFPLDVGHRVVQQSGAHPVMARDFARIDEGQDVGVLEVRGDADFAQEPFGAERGGHFGMEDLEGDGAVVLDDVREKHGRNAAASHFSLDLVNASDSVRAQHADVCHTVLPYTPWFRAGTGRPWPTPRTTMNTKPEKYTGWPGETTLKNRKSSVCTLRAPPNADA